MSKKNEQINGSVQEIKNKNSEVQQLTQDMDATIKALEETVEKIQG